MVKKHSNKNNIFNIDSFSRLVLSLRVLLILTIIINIGILLTLPSHFSAIALVLLVSSILALRRNEKHMRKSRFIVGALIAFTVSVLFASVILSWQQKGNLGCAGFFGISGSCFGSVQHILFEFYATPFIMALVTVPLLSKSRSRTGF